MSHTRACAFSSFNNRQEDIKVVGFLVVVISRRVQ